MMIPEPPKLKQNLIDGSNLMRAVPADRVNPSPRAYKLILLEILTVGSALALGASYSFFLFMNGSVALFVAVLSVFILFSNIMLFATKSMERRIGVLVLETIAMLLSFFSLPLRTLALSGALVFIFLAWGEVAGFRELQNALEIRFSKIVKIQIKKILTAIVCMVIVLYLAQWGTGGNTLFSASNITPFFGSTAGFVQRWFYPRINFMSTFSDFTKSLARYELETNPAFRDLGPAEKTKALTDTASQLAENLQKTFGATIDPQEPLSNAFYAFLLSSLERFHASLGDSFLVGWGIAAFFILEGIAALFRAIMVFVGYFVYQLLLATNVLAIMGESRMRETIDFS